MKIKLYY